MSSITPLTTRMIASAQEASLELEQADVLVEAGRDEGQRQQLGLASLTIGTHNGCDLVLHDPAVSARHARIETSTNGYLLKDLQSRNGTYVGDLQISGARLHDQMQFRVGTTQLRVVSRRTTQAIPLAPAGSLGRIVARSVKMRSIVPLIERYARSDLALLLQGETGTGKEVIARTVHEMSPRSDGPFVCVDCGAIPEQLIGSELFGHERGAFTGADSSRSGLFEQARGGTLFLDEVGELPLALQPFLLGAIERKKIRRVGGGLDISIDVRVLSATNRNLQEAVARGTFRRDLFYRLSAAQLRVPPLRERPEDIRHLARQFAADQEVPLAPELLRAFLSYQWPGNVRELRNVIEQLSVSGQLSIGSEPRTRSIPLDLLSNGVLIPLKEARALLSHRLERVYIEEALTFCDGNFTRAARYAGISRSLFMRLARKHRLRMKDTDTDSPEPD